MLNNENKRLRKILEEVKKKTGIGIILNTSLNLHGHPIVNTPEEALHVMNVSKSHYMFIENYIIEL